MSQTVSVLIRIDIGPIPILPLPFVWPVGFTILLPNEQGFDVADRKMNYQNEVEAQFKVPVSGSNGKGHLFIHGCKDEDMNWRLNKCTLEVDETSKLLPDEIKNKFVVLYAEERHGPIENYCRKKEKPTSAAK